MQFLLGILIYIIIGAATWFVASFITSIIGYDGDIVYIVSFALVLATPYYVARKHKSNKEKRIIKNWSQYGYESAIAMLNEVLPEGYRINKNEERAFINIFNGSINEAKKQHFDNKAKDSDEKWLKDEDKWLAVTMVDYCGYKCSWETIYEGTIEMLKYVGEYSEPNKYSGELRYYDKYEFTTSGIVAEKIMLACAILTNGFPAEFKNNIDKGWVGVEKSELDEE